MRDARLPRTRAGVAAGEPGDGDPAMHCSQSAAVPATQKRRTGHPLRRDEQSGCGGGIAHDPRLPEHSRRTGHLLPLSVQNAVWVRGLLRCRFCEKARFRSMGSLDSVAAVGKRWGTVPSGRSANVRARDDPRGPRGCSTVVPFPFFRTRCCFEAGNPGHLLRLVQNAGVVLTDGNSRRCQSPKNGKRKSPQGLGSARRGSTQEVARGISCGMCRPRVAVGEARPRAHHPDTWARHWAAAMPPTTWQFSAA